MASTTATSFSELDALSALTKVTISRRRNDFPDGSLAPLCASARLQAFALVEALTLYDNELRDVDAALRLISPRAPKVVLLNLGRNLISSLTALESFPNLVSLLLEENELVRLPALGNLKCLKVLRLTHNRFASLDVRGLPDLEELAVDSNQLVRLPEGIETLSKLKIFNARDNLLAQLPDGLGDCAALTVLALSSNRLTELPQSFEKLQNLETCYLNANLFQSMPNCLFSSGACPKLRRVNLASCKLKTQLAGLVSGAIVEPFGTFSRDELPNAPNDRFGRGERIIVVAYNEGAHTDAASPKKAAKPARAADEAAPMEM
ncbi:hypothetical protein M885DRAFT_613865 [Pelagophyceae sp. CCMP2097]|nr:hypothetical protein M885DRAFT_613865 [Pelagophyceae sp. CCMP2097]